MQNPHYDQLGGDAGIRELVDRFYDIMDSAPEAWEIRQIHAESLDGSRDKLYKFLSGWLGGPQLYVQEYGHPRLRARHLPFPIGKEEADQWIFCMEAAMDEMNIDGQLRQDLSNAFRKTADHMRNKMEPVDPVRPTDTNPFPIGPSAAERREHGLD